MLNTTVAELADQCSPSGVVFLGGGPDVEVRATTCVIRDPLVALPPGSAEVVLGVGVGPAQVTEVISELLEAGIRVLVVRMDEAGEVAAAVAQAVSPQHPFGVLGVPPTAQWSHVEQLLTAALERTGKPGDNPFDLVDTLATMVGGAVVIEDAHRQVLAYSRDDRHAIDEARERSILGRWREADASRDARYEAVARAHEPVWLAPIAGGYGRLALASRMGDELLGTVWVIDDGNLKEDAADMLVSSLALFTASLLRQRYATTFADEHRSALVRQLVSGGTAARDAATHLGLAAAGGCRVIALGLDPLAGVDQLPPERWTRFLTMVKTYLAAWQPSGVFGTIGDISYVLVTDTIARDTDRIILNIEIIIDRARGFEVPVRAGIGSYVDKASDSQRSRDDADALISTLVKVGDPAILDADKHHGRLALQKLRYAVGEQDELLSPAALKLIAHDQERNSDLAHTWASWFSHGMDTKRTATALSLHPNSVRYRLARAAEVSGIGSEEDDLLIAWLTIRLRT